MTSYPGGKQRFGADIARAIRKVYDKAAKKGIVIKGYCEPFVGMCGVYQHIPELFEDVKGMKYLAGDLNKSLILMWKAAQRGVYPSLRKTTAERYLKLKNSKDTRSTAEKGFIGHIFGFRSIYFNGIQFRMTSSNIIHSINRIKYISKQLNQVKFNDGCYDQFNNLKHYIIYCDPPYDNTHQNYRDEFKQWNARFDSNKFAEWCKQMARNNIVLISEYNKPRCKCKCIFKKNKECLYIVCG